LMRYYERGNVPHYFLAGIVSYGPKNCGTKDIPGVSLTFKTPLNIIFDQLINFTGLHSSFKVH
jgi:secreted trypsin-like serine protease